MDQYTVSSLALAGVASHGIAVVQMRMLGWIDLDGTATPIRSAIRPSLMPSIVASSRFASLSSAESAVSCTRSPIAVFEVLSPEDSTSRLLVKLDDHALMGIQNIFVVDPKTERIYKHVGGDLRLCVGNVPLEAVAGHVDWGAIASLRDE